MDQPGHLQSSGQIVEYQSVGCDVTELRRAKARLLHDALHDGLTGMPNRTLFMDRLEQAITFQRHLSSLQRFVDLDRFKVVNDSLGHLVGDKLFNCHGTSTAKLFRDNATLARLGVMNLPLLADICKTEMMPR